MIKKDPGRTSQNSLDTAGTSFTKSGAHIKEDLCMVYMSVLSMHSGLSHLKDVRRWKEGNVPSKDTIFYSKSLHINGWVLPLFLKFN